MATGSGQLCWAELDESHNCDLPDGHPGECSPFRSVADAIPQGG